MEGWRDVSNSNVCEWGGSGLGGVDGVARAREGNAARAGERSGGAAKGGMGGPPHTALRICPKTEIKKGMLRFCGLQPIRKEREWMGHGTFLPGWKWGNRSSWTGSESKSSAVSFLHGSESCCISSFHSHEFSGTLKEWGRVPRTLLSEDTYRPHD